jgi:hypothetical protein
MVPNYYHKERTKAGLFCQVSNSGQLEAFVRHTSMPHSQMANPDQYPGIVLSY